MSSTATINEGQHTTWVVCHLDEHSTSVFKYVQSSSFFSSFVVFFFYECKLNPLLLKRKLYLIESFEFPPVGDE